jgi:cell division protein FtsB
MIFISIFFFVAIVKMNMQINDMKVELGKSRTEVEQRKLSIEKIQSEIDAFPNDTGELDQETIKKIAREKLNLQDSDIIIFANSQPN